MDFLPLWISIVQVGHQLAVKSMIRALTEDEAMAYYAICKFIKIKAEVDAFVLERHLRDERDSKAERGGP